MEGRLRLEANLSWVMAGKEHMGLKAQAKEQGYLRYDEPLKNAYSVEIWWEERCSAEGVPTIQAVRREDEEKLCLSLTLPPGVRFSPYAYEKLSDLLERYSDSYSTDAKGVSITVESASLDAIIAELTAVYLEDQTEERRKLIESYWSSPLEGMARCLCADGLGKDIAVGDVVYVREIPNMLGHCIVLKNGAQPLVGFHLDRFELLYPYE